MIKKFFKSITKKTAETTKSVITGAIEGADEAINGDDIKEVRIKKQILREKQQAEWDRLYELDQNRKKTLWNWFIVAVLAVLFMIGRVIYREGFRNDSVQIILDTYGIALIFPFVVYAILYLMLRSFIWK